MLDLTLNNSHLLPGEAYTAAGSFSEKLLDKVSNAIGWAVIPKNTHKYRLEAENYLIEQIKNNNNMPELTKAACISHARKIIKQYINQCDIFLEASNYLGNDENYKNAENIDDDWLDYFFEKAKVINKEDMKLIWGKVLAKEIENPNSISKHLLHILTVINKQDAISFGKLVDYVIWIENKPAIAIYQQEARSFYSKNGLTDEDMIRLEDTGLVQNSNSCFSYELEPSEKIFYFGKEINISNARTIYVGQSLLSRAGEELISVLSNGTPNDEFELLLNEQLTVQKNPI